MIAPGIQATLAASGVSIEELAAHLASVAAAAPKDDATLERSTVTAFVAEARRAMEPGTV